MPPRAKITKEMIAEAAFEVPRAEGAGKINARRVSQKLGCSTQPVMYHFKTMGELKKRPAKGRTCTAVHISAIFTPANRPFQHTWNMYLPGRCTL